MEPLFSENKQKYLSVAIVTLTSFFGFEAMSSALEIYQLRTFVSLSVYIFLFHIFWLTFIFDLHLKKRSVLANLRPTHSGWALAIRALKDRTSHLANWHYLRHYINFLVLPSLIYWSCTILIFLNPFQNLVKQLVIISSTLFLAVAYWHFKKVYSRNLEIHAVPIKILSLVKLFTAFLVYSAALGYVWYFGYGSGVLMFVVFFSTLGMLYQAVFQHRLLGPRTLHFMLLISALVSAASLMVYDLWNIEYFTGGLVMLAVYNLFWGMLHHKMEGNLNAKLVFEYLLMTILFLSILVGGHNFGPRIR